MNQEKIDRQVFTEVSCMKCNGITEVVVYESELKDIKKHICGNCKGRMIGR